MKIKKIVMVGDFATGKTSLIRRYVDNQFSDEYLTTIGVKISKKIVDIDGDKVQLMIWDIEGNTEYKPINISYLQGAHGAIIVADVTRDKTIENIKLHIDMVRKVKKDMPIVIALNKVDLIDNMHLREEILQNTKKLYGIEDIYLTSAKSAENVEKIFVDLALKS